MTNTNIIERIAETTRRLRTKFVAAYYLLTILTSAFILFFHGSFPFAADLTVTFFYLAATALLYDLSQPKPKSIPLIAALFYFAQLAVERVRFRPHGRTAHRIAPGGV
jgi:hypothetical protein